MNEKMEEIEKLFEALPEEEKERLKAKEEKFQLKMKAKVKRMNEKMRYIKEQFNKLPEEEQRRLREEADRLSVMSFGGINMIPQPPPNFGPDVDPEDLGDSEVPPKDSGASHFGAGGSTGTQGSETFRPQSFYPPPQFLYSPWPAFDHRYGQFLPFPYPQSELPSNGPGVQAHNSFPPSFYMKKLRRKRRGILNRRRRGAGFTGGASFPTRSGTSPRSSPYFTDLDWWHNLDSLGPWESTRYLMKHQPYYRYLENLRRYFQLYSPQPLHMGRVDPQDFQHPRSPRF